MAKSKTASSKSKFDFQKFFLEKGEKVGLIVAGVGFALLVLFGIMAAAGAANPTKLTNDIKTGIASVDSRLQQSSDAPPPVQIPDKDSVFVTVKPTDFPTPYELFNVSGTISEKRNNPTLLTLIEGVARYQIGGFGTVMTQGEQVAVVKDVQGKARNNSGAIANLLKAEKQRAKGILPKEAPAIPVAPTQLPPPVVPGGQGKAGGGRANAPVAGAGKASESEIVYVSLDSPEVNNAVFAINLRPVRMARIQGIVPYKMQVEKYLRALRLNDDAQLTAEKLEPTYKGFNVERQILDADGKKVIKDWTYFDHVKAMENFQEPSPGTRLLFAAYEKLDERLKDFIPEPIHMLFMKAPLLAHGSYETVQLVELGRALQELEKSGPPKDLTDKEKKLKGKGNPFDPVDLLTPGQVGSGPQGGSIQGAPPGGGRAPAPGAGKGNDPRVGGMQQATTRTNAAPVWLLQFIDPTIEAGFCYKYRVQLKAVNPNYNKRDLVAFPGLALQEELVSDWFEIADVVFAKPEEYIYAHGDKLKERPSYGTPDYDTTSVKYHRWYEYVRVTKDGGIPDPVGEWVVADVSAKRGQFIQDTKMFRLPLWSMVTGSYAFRDPINRVGDSKSRMKGENVNMEFRPLKDTLLVDFDGGSGIFRLPKAESVVDQCVAEILIITEEGTAIKVCSRNTVADKADAERKAREEAWLRWLEEVRTAGDRPNNTAAPAGKAG